MTESKYDPHLGGNMSAMRRCMQKWAEASREEGEVKRPALHAIHAMGGPLLAFGGGMAAGYLGQMGVEKLLGDKLTPRRVSMVVPALAGVGGLAYQQYKALEAKELRRALESHKNQRERAAPAAQLQNSPAASAAGSVR